MRTFPRVPALTEEDLERVARAIAVGWSQRLVAAQLGWSKARVQRCVTTLRTDVAKERDSGWLDSGVHPVVEVAQEWLRLRGQ